MADMPISAADPTPTDMPPEAPEGPSNADIPVSLKYRYMSSYQQFLLDFFTSFLYTPSYDQVYRKN